MELQPLLFWIIAVLTGASAVGVVVTQNIVRAAAFLLFALGGTAGIFFLLGADFVGATQLLIYVGGTPEAGSMLRVVTSLTITNSSAAAQTRASA